MIDKPESNCTYTRLSNGIHKLSYTDLSKDTVQTFIGFIKEILLSASPQEKVLLLADGTHVIEYQTLEMDEMIQMHQLGKQYKDTFSIRAVALDKQFDATWNDGEGQGTIMGMADIFFNSIAKDFHHFESHQRSIAVDWLLEVQ